MLFFVFGSPVVTSHGHPTMKCLQFLLWAKQACSKFRATSSVEQACIRLPRRNDTIRWQRESALS